MCDNCTDVVTLTLEGFRTFPRQNSRSVYYMKKEHDHLKRHLRQIIRHFTPEQIYRIGKQYLTEVRRRANRDSFFERADYLVIPKDWCPHTLSMHYYLIHRTFAFSVDSCTDVLNVLKDLQEEC